MKTKKRVVLIILIAVVSAVVLIAAAAAVILSKAVFVRHPELQGEPETGKWYRITRIGTMTKNRENGDLFQKDLTQMVYDLQENIPDIGIYIWKLGEDAETHNTQHTIISSNIFDKLEDDTSVSEWIYGAVNGDVRSHGLHLLEN